MSTRTLMIVPAAQQPQANALAAQVDKDKGGAHTFETPLRPKGGGEVTHYAAYGPLNDADLAAVQTVFLPQFPGASVHITEDWRGVLAEIGLEVAVG